MAPKSIVYRLFPNAHEAGFWHTDNNLLGSMTHQLKFAQHQEDICLQAGGVVLWPQGNTLPHAVWGEV